MMQVRIVIRWAPKRMNGKMRNAVVRLRCLIGGHKEQIVCRDNMMALRCERCGQTSRGWQLDRSGSRPVR